MTYDEWIASQITGAYINGSSGDADVTFSANLQNSLNSWADYYIENNTGIEYAYSFIPQDFRSTFGTESGFNYFVSLVNENNYSIRYRSDSNVYFYIFNEDLENIDFVKTGADDPNLCFADAYLDWSPYPVNSSNFTVYSYSAGGYVVNTSLEYYSRSVSF